jgi:hypothetical protein
MKKKHPRLRHLQKWSKEAEDAESNYEFFADEAMNALGDICYAIDQANFEKFHKALARYRLNVNRFLREGERLEGA